MTREGVITALQMAEAPLHVHIMERAGAGAEQKRRLARLLPGGGSPQLNNGEEALFTASTHRFFFFFLFCSRQTNQTPAGAD